jgi:hypothetical protein
MLPEVSKDGINVSLVSSGKQEPLGVAANRAVDRVIGAILTTWAYTTKPPKKLPLWLATGEKFYEQFVKSKLLDQLNEDTNTSMTFSDAQNLQDRVEVCQSSYFFRSLILILYRRMTPTTLSKIKYLKPSMA